MAKTGKIFIERIRDESSYRRPSGPLWQPAVDIYKTPEGWKIKLDLAGVRPRELRDTMIAGIVLARRATLATRNISHFDDVSATLVDPWAASN